MLLMQQTFRPPRDTAASIEDFRASPWQAAASTMDSYFAWWNFLMTKGAQATEAGQVSQAKVLWLLADACSLRMRPFDANEPLTATEVDEFRQPRGLSSFSEADIDLLTEIYPEVEDNRLRARLADICWLQRQPKRKFQDALAAIDAYRSTSLDADAWHNDSDDCWRRGISLALRTRPGSGQRVEEMTARLMDAVVTALTDGEPDGVVLSQAKLLLQFQLVGNSSERLAALLLGRGQQFRTSGTFFLARAYFTTAKAFFISDGKPTRAAEMSFATAQAFVDEAATRSSDPHPSYMVATSFYEDAIRELRTIPKDFREACGAAKELPRLYALRDESADRQMDEFVQLQVPIPDFHKEIKVVRELTAGQDILEALRILATCHSYTSKEAALNAARASLDRTFLSRVFATRQLASGGRLAATTPPAGDASFETDEAKQAIWDNAVRAHQDYMQNVVTIYIEPALSQFLEDHLMNQDDLESIVARSRIVPGDRVWLVAKGLKAGFELDFVTALHLLVPQLENLVRVHLKRHKVVTTAIDDEKDATLMEVGLSALVERTGMDEAFGQDLTFEIRAVFCEQVGPNFRNNLAHGLLSPGAANSKEALYSWWLIFKLVYEHYWFGT